MKKSIKTSAAARAASRQSLAQLGKLRAAFRNAVDVLKRRRADLLQPSAIEAYVACDWLAWQGGSLKLTIVGENVYAQLRRESLGGAAP